MRSTVPTAAGRVIQPNYARGHRIGELDSSRVERPDPFSSNSFKSEVAFSPPEGPCDVVLPEPSTYSSRQKPPSQARPSAHAVGTVRHEVGVASDMWTEAVEGDSLSNVDGLAGSIGVPRFSVVS